MKSRTVKFKSTKYFASVLIGIVVNLDISLGDKRKLHNVETFNIYLFA